MTKDSQFLHGRMLGCWDHAHSRKAQKRSRLRRVTRRQSAHVPVVLKGQLRQPQDVFSTLTEQAVGHGVEQGWGEGVPSPQTALQSTATRSQPQHLHER